MTQPVAVFQGQTLYLDTMIPYALLRNIEAEAAKNLFQRLQVGEFHAFTSVLTFDELAYRLLLAAIRDNHPGNPLDHLRQNEAQLITTVRTANYSSNSKASSFPQSYALGCNSQRHHADESDDAGAFFATTRCAASGGNAHLQLFQSGESRC